MESQKIKVIRKKLDEINRHPNEYWMKSLNERKRAELEFHDKYRDQSQMDNIDQDTFDKIYGNKKYYSATYLSKKYIADWIVSEAKDKVFLDYCCGNGTLAIEAARVGAALSIGMDLSSISVSNAAEKASEAGVASNTYFVQGDAEKTLLPDRSIDRIICSGVLHHLDLANAFPELRRILSTGGKILALEALNYNPAIKIYRYLTPEMRTDWEKGHILSMKDIRFAKKYFEVGEIRFWHILGILQPHLKFMAPLLHAMDRVVTRVPLLQLMAWIFTFELKKI
jgi:ubiquinone/menaquinone biosynthesis C-methylase UbiE